MRRLTTTITGLLLTLAVAGLLAGLRPTSGNR
jgi:hypothetical protein